MAVTKFLSLIIGIMFITFSCSSDDPGVKLEVAPEIKTATEVTSTSFTANWEKVDGADFYKLEVSRNIDFTLLVDGYNPKEVSGISADITGLDETQKYFYRVRAGNRLDETGNSEIEGVRSIDRLLLYNTLWKSDEVKSNIKFFMEDIYFNSDNTYQSFFEGNLLSSGTWEWQASKDVMTLNYGTGSSYKIRFVDVSEGYYIAYISSLRSGLAYFNN